MSFEYAAKVLGYAGWGEMSPARLLPVADHIRDDVAMYTDGSVLGVSRWNGAPHVLLANSERNAQWRRHVAWLNAISDDNIEIYEYFVSHRHVPALPDRPADVAPYASRLLGDYHTGLQDELYMREWIVAIRVKPRNRLFGIRLDRIPLANALLDRRKASMSDDEELDDLIKQLDEAFRLHRAILGLGSVRLGVREEDGVVHSEIMEALYLALRTEHAPQPLVDPTGLLGVGLCTDSVICGRRGFEVRYGPMGTRSTYGLMGGFRVYPRGQLNPRTFDRLLSLEGRYTILAAFVGQTRAQAQEALSMIRRQMTAGGDLSEDGQEELQDAIRALAAGRSERGLHRWSVAIHGETMAEVDRLYTAVKNILAPSGARFTAEGVGTTASYWGQFIGGPARNWIRRAFLETRQHAMLSTFSGFPAGPDTPRWGRLFRMATTGLTPFDFDLFVGDVGHTAVIGPNGGGKTVFMGLSIAALDAVVRGQGGAQIILDVDDSHANTIRALEGVYVDIRAAEDSGVAPLRGLANTPRVRLMLRQFIRALCFWDGGRELTAEERQGIDDGVDFVMHEVEPSQRRFSMVRRFMGYAEGGAGERFEPWCLGGEYGWAFDGERHDLDLGTGLVGVNLTQVMNDPHVMPPMAMLLMWLASEVMDGRRCVLWAEEAPAYLPEPRFSGMFKGIALRARKRNAAFIAVAQMPDDLLSNPAGEALVKQARQLILFANPKAEDVEGRYSAYRDGLGLNEPEMQMVREGMLGLPYHSVFIKRQDGRSSVNKFDLSNHRQHLAVLSSTPRSAALLKGIMAANPERTMAANLDEFWQRIGETAA